MPDGDEPSITPRARRGPGSSCWWPDRRGRNFPVISVVERRSARKRHRFRDRATPCPGGRLRHRHVEGVRGVTAVSKAGYGTRCGAALPTPGWWRPAPGARAELPSAGHGGHRGAGHPSTASRSRTAFILRPAAFRGGFSVGGLPACRPALVSDRHPGRQRPARADLHGFDHGDNPSWRHPRQQQPGWLDSWRPMPELFEAIAGRRSRLR